MNTVRITHISSKQILAEDPLGWGITKFEGNFYIQKRYLLTNGFKLNYIPSIYWYKFFYVSLDLQLNDKVVSHNIAWFYFLPNPLLPFIGFRVTLSSYNPNLLIEYIN